MEKLHTETKHHGLLAFIGWLLTGPHCLSTHGDHLPHDPLATPAKMWTDNGKPIPFPQGWEQAGEALEPPEFGL